jgi:excisionase family DNA binding protein
VQTTPMLYTPDHAAKLLGISRSKLYELLDAEIPSVHVGRLRRIRHVDLEAYVAALTA